MTPSIRRGFLAATVLASLLVPAVAADAGSSFHASGIVSSVNTRAGMLVVRNYGGDRSVQGRTISIRVTSATQVGRDGKRTALGAVQSGDTIDVTGRSSPGLVALHVDATSPPRPDAAAVGTPRECLGYYLPCTPSAPPLPGSKQLSITIRDYTFDLPVNAVPINTVVVVRNTDAFDHTFSGNHLDSGDLDTNTTYAVEFTTPGTYRFFCSIHPFMTGVLEVS